MSTYLVTGGAGFIGSHIVDALLMAGHNVRVLDDFSSGKTSNIQQVIDRITLIQGSIADLDTVKQAAEGVDYVLHHAALVSVPGSVDNPLAANLLNIDGTLNVLVAARDAGVKRVVYASSSAVYGNIPDLPKNEGMKTDLLSPYALTKLTGEHYCQLFTKLYGLATVTLRYFNVFGPRQDPNSLYAAVIPKFIETIIQGKRPIIYGDGMQSRDFSYVQNNVKANILACKMPGVEGEVFNISCGQSFTLIELVAAINQILGTRVEPIFEPIRAGDVKHSLADVTKATEMLGYSPSVTFIDGLEQLIRWTKDHS